MLNRFKEKSMGGLMGYFQFLRQRSCSTIFYDHEVAQDNGHVLYFSFCKSMSLKWLLIRPLFSACRFFLFSFFKVPHNQPRQQFLIKLFSSILVVIKNIHSFTLCLLLPFSPPYSHVFALITFLQHLPVQFMPFHFYT